jgi:DNA repair protein RadC
MVNKQKRTIKDLPEDERPRGKHKSAGHRARLRLRFLQGGLDAFLDYEIVELLLTLGTPLRDCKPMAKEAIAKFGRLRDVLDASPEELQEIKGIGPMNIFGLKLFQAISERYAKEQIPKEISLSSPRAVAGFLQKRIGREKREQFVTLALDTRNHLVKVSSISVGTLDASLIHPREVFREAIQASAAGVIIAHNHPSGHLEPSEEDLEATQNLIAVGKIIGIHVIDHVIITKSGFLSLREKSFI